MREGELKDAWIQTRAARAASLLDEALRAEFPNLKPGDLSVTGPFASNIVSALAVTATATAAARIVPQMVLIWLP